MRAFQEPNAQAKYHRRIIHSKTCCDMLHAVICTPRRPTEATLARRRLSVVERVGETRSSPGEEPMRAVSRRVFAAALLAGSILPISLASAQEIQERTIKLAYV